MRFAHVNVIARDWRRLVDFYQEVFGCRPVPPERDQSGAWLEAATDLPGAHIRGVHLRLPGGGPDGPTLEIYSYETMPPRPEIRANTPGFSHIAFRVDDVEAVVERIFAAGGGAAGEPVQVEVEGAGRLSFRYMTDPEGNILEIQSWS